MPLRRNGSYARAVLCGPAREANQQHGTSAGGNYVHRPHGVEHGYAMDERGRVLADRGAKSQPWNLSTCLIYCHTKHIAPISDLDGLLVVGVVELEGYDGKGPG